MTGGGRKEGVRKAGSRQGDRKRVRETGRQGVRTAGRQDNSEGGRKGVRGRNGGMHDGRDAGKEKCKKEKRREAGTEGCKTGEMLDRRKAKKREAGK